jgi:integrase
MSRQRRERGEGRVHQRKSDGRWCGSITIGYRDGKRIDKWVYGSKKREVLQKLDKLKREYQQGLHVQGQRQTVEQFLQAWLEAFIKPPRRKRSTYQSYEEMTRLYIIPALGHIQLDKLAPEHVQHMVNELSKTHLSPRTVQYTASILSRALNKAVNFGYLARNVVQVVEIPRVERRLIKPLDTQQAHQFLHAVAGHRLEPLYRVALSLGLRRGEILALSWNDIDFHHSTLTVQAGKTESARRTLNLPDFLMTMLREHQREQHEEQVALGAAWKEHGLVFPSEVGTPINPRNLVRHFKATLERAGLPSSIRFHDLRHSCATFLLAQGASLHVVKDILGHSRIGVTADIYGHVLPEAQKEAIGKVESLFG